MHRGTMFVVLNNNEVWKSTEFNGGMGLDCYGEDVVKVFEKVKTLQNFKDMVLAFDKTHHNYQDDVMFYKADEQSKPYINERGEKYFDYYRKKNNYNFFRDSRKGYIYTSDSNYIKNLSDKEIGIVCNNGTYILKPNQLLVSDYDKCINNTKISFGKRISKNLNIENLETNKEKEIENEKNSFKEDKIIESNKNPDIVDDMFD